MALSHSLKIFYSLEKYNPKDFECQILSQLLNEKHQKKLFIKWLQIRRSCFTIAKIPHKFKIPLTTIFYSESQIRVFANMIENDHYNTTRNMKFRQVDFEYDDVSLEAVDALYGCNFASPQVTRYKKEEEEMEFRRKALKKNIALQKAEDLQNGDFHTMGMRRNLNLERNLQKNTKKVNLVSRVDRNLSYKFIRWSRMFLEKIQKFRVLSRSRNSQQAEYAKQDLEFNKHLFHGTNITIALLCYKIFQFFFEIDEEEMDLDVNNQKHFETTQVGNNYRPRNSDILELDDEGNLVGISKINAFVQHPTGLNMTQDMNASYYNPLNKTNQTFRTPTQTEMQGKKDALVLEIQDLNKRMNDKKQAILMMTGLMRSIDEFLIPGSEQLERNRCGLNKFRVLIENEELLRIMFMQSGGTGAMLFYKQGTSMPLNNYKSLDKVPFKHPISKKKILDTQFNARGYYSQKKNFLTLLHHTLRMNEVAFKKPKLNRKERDLNSLKETQKGIEFYNQILAAYSTQKQKTPFRDDDRSVNLEDEVAVNVQVSDFDEMNLKFDELKKQVQDKISSERRAKQLREAELEEDKEAREALERGDDSFLQTTQERLQKKNKAQEEDQIQDELGDYNLGDTGQDGDEDELKEVTGLDSGLIDENDIEIIDDDDINYTLNENKDGGDADEPELLPYSDDEEDNPEGSKKGSDLDFTPNETTEPAQIVEPVGGEEASPDGKNNDTFIRDFPEEEEKTDRDIKNDTLGLDVTTNKALGAEDFNELDQMSDEEAKPITEVLEDGTTMRGSQIGDDAADIKDSVLSELNN